MAGGKVGFIGVGIMGAGMVRNVLKGGFEVRVFDLNPDAVEEIVRAGATGREFGGGCGPWRRLYPGGRAGAARSGGGRLRSGRSGGDGAGRGDLHPARHDRPGDHPQRGRGPGGEGYQNPGRTPAADTGSRGFGEPGFSGRRRAGRPGRGSGVADVLWRHDLRDRRGGHRLGAEARKQHAEYHHPLRCLRMR